jgi:catechol-2,3-dioxygenase
MLEKGRARGIETRGVIDHGFIHSVYFRDPNGYVIELAATMPSHAREMDPAINGARAKLDAWTRERRGIAPAAA